MIEIQDILIGAFVISMMLSVGADLTWSRLWEIAKKPPLLIGGMLAGYIVVPLSAYFIGQYAGMTGPVHAGLLLCAAAPGGPIGAMFTQRANGNLALVVSLLMMFNFINLFATPLTLQALGATPSANIIGELLGMFFTILGFQVAPLVAGVQLRERSPQMADKVGKYGKTIANVLLLGAVIGMSVSQSNIIRQLELRTVAAVQTVSLIALVSGWLCIPGDRRSKTAGALSNTMRSQSLAILLASTRFATPETLLTVISYSVLMFFNGFIASEIFRRYIIKFDTP